MDYIKVKDKDYLIRDLNSNAIINLDTQGYAEYEENYKRSYNSTQKLLNLEKDLNNIKDDVNEIKYLLRRLVNEPG